MNMLRHLLNSLLDIIYPRICLVCKKNLKNVNSLDNLVCIECWREIKRNVPPFCYHCGRHLETKEINQNLCFSCLNKKLYFDRAFSPCIYEGVIKELIHQFKYKNKDYLGSLLSKLMIEFIQEYNLPLENLDFIVPVPLHKRRLHQRQFNQAEILSEHIAKSFNKKMLNDVLYRSRYTKTQTELEEEMRFINVEGSFTVNINKKELIKNKNILLVDDVLTTGATASWAAYALKMAGAGIVFVLTLAN